MSATVNSAYKLQILVTDFSEDRRALISRISYSKYVTNIMFLVSPLEVTTPMLVTVYIGNDFSVLITD